MPFASIETTVATPSSPPSSISTAPAMIRTPPYNIGSDGAAAGFLTETALENLGVKSEK